MSCHCFRATASIGTSLKPRRRRGSGSRQSRSRPQAVRGARCVAIVISHLIRKTYRKIAPATPCGVEHTVSSWARSIRRVVTKAPPATGLVTGLQAHGSNGPSADSMALVSGLQVTSRARETTSHPSPWLIVSGRQRPAARVLRIAGRLPLAPEVGRGARSPGIGPLGGNRACEFRSWRDQRSVLVRTNASRRRPRQEAFTFVVGVNLLGIAATLVNTLAIDAAPASVIVAFV
jgi:hypothetical protein